MRVKALLSLLLITLAVVASGCTSSGTNTTLETPGETAISGFNAVGSTTLLLVITDDEIHNAYLIAKNDSEILIVPENYDVGLEIKDNKASITQKELWVFWSEPNNVIRVEKLKSSKGFTFKAKEIYGNNLVSQAFGVKTIPSEYKELLKGLPSYEPLDKLPSNFEVARKVSLSELAKGITIDEIINNYPKLNDTKSFSDKYAFFVIVNGGGAGPSSSAYTGEIIPLLKADLWYEIELQGPINNAVVGGPPKEQRSVAVAIPIEAVSKDTSVELEYNPNSKKGTVTVKNLKTTDGYAIVVTLG